MISIILAEDHQVVREALRLLLDAQEDFHVLAETGSGLEAVSLTETHEPDVLIADIMMPDLSGLDVARAVKRASPATKVIVLSMHDAESYVVEALQAGVAGYVLKRGSSQELTFAIRQALSGSVYLSPSLNERAIEAYKLRSMESRGGDPYETLTPRERVVFQLAAEGMSNRQIAQKLQLSVRTVEMHRGNLMRKLGMKSQTELVKYAVKRGLVA
jgi:DNA-binding NarL/FixJ family response regulator